MSIILIKNLSADTVSSLMMDQLAKQIKNQPLSINNLSIEKTAIQNQKCDITTIISFSAGIVSSLIASMLWDALKAVYVHSKHPKSYEWKLEIHLDQVYKVSILSTKDNHVNISINTDI